MSSIFINAPSSSSSMKRTYPPSRNKPSIEELKQGNCNPTRNKRSHPRVIRTSSASLRLGRRCRHSRSLHSRKEVVTKMGKGKPKADGKPKTDGNGKPKADGNEVRTGWKDPKELKAYCDLSAAQVLDGKKHNGFLRKEGVDEVIEQLGEMGKVVTPTQFKNKWDHLRKCWKTWKECFSETGLGYDPVTGVIHMTDEWWTRKIQACPKAATYKNKPLPNIKSMEIMFEGTIATGKHAFCTSGEIPNDCTEGFGDSADSKEFVDPQCEPSANSVDPMEVEGPASSRARPAVNKGKGLASGFQLFRGICKKPRKKRSTMQEMSDSLKSMSDVIVESRSVSTHNTPFRTTSANEMQAIMDMVLTLPGVQAGDRLHMFSTFFFMNNVDGRNMFAANVERKEVQLRWLEKQYEMNPQFHVL
ncbi:L10-interacting MYB domain-containing protein-like [Quercus robur]|uniref:L10-interacting MYB domain-containing protein-like n=1 Tax=Quercus robur TaxID=38942 RepID=UPI0021635C60|nr:L10-interacting MYB domain-containing protein-like [Quercus robur]